MGKLTIVFVKAIDFIDYKLNLIYCFFEVNGFKEVMWFIVMKYEI